MKGWKIAAFGAALVLTAGIGAGVAPVAHGQTRTVRAPSSQVIDVFKGGSRIGVSIRDVEEADAPSGKGASGGVMVEDVAADSPAEKAGIRKGDVIVELDGDRVRSVRQLTRLVQETPSGRSVQTVLLRDGQRTTVAVTPREGDRFHFDSFEELGDRMRDLRYRVAPAPPAPPARPMPPSAWVLDDLLGRSTSRLGLTVSALSSQLAEYFGTKDGVLVTSVSDGSAAAKAGVKAGDVITSLNGSPVDAPADVRRRIQNLNDGEEVTIVVVRDRKPVTLKGKAERTERRPTGRSIL